MHLMLAPSSEAGSSRHPTTCSLQASHNRRRMSQLTCLSVDPVAVAQATHRLLVQAQRSQRAQHVNLLLHRVLTAVLHKLDAALFSRAIGGGCQWKVLHFLGKHAFAECRAGRSAVLPCHTGTLVAFSSGSVSSKSRNTVVSQQCPASVSSGKALQCNWPGPLLVGTAATAEPSSLGQAGAGWPSEPLANCHLKPQTSAGRGCRC